MKNGKQARARRGVEGWRQIVERYERRNVTADEFCKREGIAASSLWLWRSRLGGTVKEVARGSFVEVRPEPRVLGGGVVELCFPNGMVLRVVGS